MIPASSKCSQSPRRDGWYGDEPLAATIMDTAFANDTVSPCLFLRRWWRSDAVLRWHLLSPKRGLSTIFKKADITDLRIYDMRRTLGSWQATMGSSLPIIERSLGHKSMASTLIYARLSAKPVRESVERATAAMKALKTADAVPTDS